MDIFSTDIICKSISGGKANRDAQIFVCDPGGSDAGRVDGMQFWGQVYGILFAILSRLPTATTTPHASDHLDLPEHGHRGRPGIHAHCDDGFYNIFSCRVERHPIATSCIFRRWVARTGSGGGHRNSRYGDHQRKRFIQYRVHHNRIEQWICIFQCCDSGE